MIVPLPDGISRDFVDVRKQAIDADVEVSVPVRCDRNAPSMWRPLSLILQLLVQIVVGSVEARRRQNDALVSLQLFHDDVRDVVGV